MEPDGPTIWTARPYNKINSGKYYMNVVVFRGNKLGISKWQKWWYPTVFHAHGFIAVSITNVFLMKKIEKSIPSRAETDAGSSFKALLWWQVLEHLRKSGEGEEQGHCSVQDWVSLLGKKGEHRSEGDKGRAVNCGAVSHFRCSKPHWNINAECISWFLLPF